ncbi:MAG: O-methyltransferase [Bacteroidales bacterium]
MSDLLEQYIINHSDEEGELLKQLTRDVHVNLLRPRMISGHLQGRILKMLCRMIKPKQVLELGTFAGYSALCFAEALQEGSVVHTVDNDDELEEFVAKYLNLSEHGEKVVQHIGNALDLIPQFEDEQFDLVFIDADKRLYSEFYDLVFPKVKSGGYILVDNTLWDGKVVVDPQPKDAQTIGILNFNDMIVQDPRVEKVILPLRDGMTMIYKK